MEELTHYIIVRRDLPFGTLCAMVAHAAGESFFQLGWDSSEKERRSLRAEVVGSSPAPGSIPTVTVVVLAIRNEARLRKLAQKLQAAGIQHVLFEESDAPYAGEAMSLGVVPQVREIVRPFVKGLLPVRQYVPGESDESY